jgi:hypothetical protein
MYALTTRAHTSRAGSRTREGSDTGGKIVGFGSERNVQVDWQWMQSRGIARRLWAEIAERMTVSTDRTRIVREGHHTVPTLLLCEGILHQLEEGSLLGYSIDHEPATEEPMPAVFAVRLADVEQLHDGGITPDLRGSVRVHERVNECRGVNERMNE